MKAGDVVWLGQRQVVIVRFNRNAPIDKKWTVRGHPSEIAVAVGLHDITLFRPCKKPDKCPIDKLIEELIDICGLRGTEGDSEDEVYSNNRMQRVVAEAVKKHLQGMEMERMAESDK